MREFQTEACTYIVPINKGSNKIKTKISQVETVEKYGFVCDHFQDGRVSPPTMVLPEELGSWRTQLQDATDQALALI